MKPLREIPLKRALDYFQEQGIPRQVVAMVVRDAATNYKEELRSRIIRDESLTNIRDITSATIVKKLKIATPIDQRVHGRIVRRSIDIGGINNNASALTKAVMEYAVLPENPENTVEGVEAYFISIITAGKASRDYTKPQ